MTERVENLVPCGSCTACCRGEAIFLYPEHGDDPAEYETKMFRGRVILAHQLNGDCVYLDRLKGCTIHDRRPHICRKLDCRTLLLLPPHVLKANISPAVIQAGKKQLKKALRDMKNKQRLRELHSRQLKRGQIVFDDLRLYHPDYGSLVDFIESGDEKQ